LVVNPIWLLMMKCTVPADPVAPQARQAENSATTPWPAKAASPWSSSGITLTRSLSGMMSFEFGGDHVLLGARLAHHHRVDDFQVRRVGGQRHVHLVAVELAVDEEAPR
jgi:hypothetical protein